MRCTSAIYTKIESDIYDEYLDELSYQILKVMQDNPKIRNLLRDILLPIMEIDIYKKFRTRIFSELVEKYDELEPLRPMNRNKENIHLIIGFSLLF